MATLGDLLEQRRQEQLAANQQASQGLAQGSTQQTKEANTIGSAQVNNKLNPLNMAAKAIPAFIAAGGPTNPMAYVAAAGSAATAPRGVDNLQTAAESAVQGAASGMQMGALDIPAAMGGDVAQQLKTVQAAQGLTQSPTEALATIASGMKETIAQKGVTALDTLEATIRQHTTASTKDEAVANVQFFKDFPEKYAKEIAALPVDKKSEFNTSLSTGARDAQSSFNALVAQGQKGDKIATDASGPWVSKIAEAKTIDQVNKVLSDAGKEKLNPGDMKVITDQAKVQKDEIQKATNESDKQKKAAGGSTAGINKDGLNLLTVASESGVDLKIPSLGLGGNNRAAFINELAAKQVKSGLSPEEFVAGLKDKQAVVDAKSQALKRIETLRNNIGAFTKTAQKNLLLTADASGKYKRFPSPIMNVLLNSVKYNLGDEGVTVFQGSIEVAINEVAKTLSGASGGAVTTDAAKKNIRDMLNSNMNSKQVQANIKLLVKELNNRMAGGFDEQISQLRNEMKNTIMGVDGNTASPVATGGKKKRVYNQATGDWE